MPHILYEKISDHAVQITINRPEVHNALNFAAIDQFAAAVESAYADSALGALIVTGAGRKAFCAGGDLKELADCITEEDGKRVSAGMTNALRRLEMLPVPTLAVINGLARGGGAEISLACDMRWMVSDASWGFTQVNQAVTPGWGSGQRLLRMVGYSRAMSLLLSGEVLSAEEARHLGIVDRVIPSDVAGSEARRWAVSLAEKPPLLLRSIKTMLRAGLNQTPEAAAEIEKSLFPPLWAAEAHHAAVRRFVNRKRKA